MNYIVMMANSFAEVSKCTYCKTVSFNISITASTFDAWTPQIDFQIVLHIWYQLSQILCNQFF